MNIRFGISRFGEDAFVKTIAEEFGAMVCVKRIARWDYQPGSRYSKIAHIAGASFVISGKAFFFPNPESCGALSLDNVATIADELGRLQVAEDKRFDTLKGDS